MKSVTYWYQFFTAREELVPILHDVKFTKCEICGSTKHTRFMNMNIHKTSSIAHLLLTFIIKYFILKLLSTSLTNPRSNGHSCHMIVELDPFPLAF